MESRKETPPCPGRMILAHTVSSLPPCMHCPHHTRSVLCVYSHCPLSYRNRRSHPCTATLPPQRTCLQTRTAQDRTVLQHTGILQDTTRTLDRSSLSLQPSHTRQEGRSRMLDKKTVRSRTIRMRRKIKILTNIELSKGMSK